MAMDIVRASVTRVGWLQAELRSTGAGQEDGPSAWLWKRSREMARDIWLVLRVRSFQLIVLQVSTRSAALELCDGQPEVHALGPLPH